MIEHKTLIELAAPFDPTQVSWRVGSTNRDKNRGLPLAYIDARDVMDRLDQVVGAENWSDSYVETPKGRIICTISIWDGEKWVSKSDGAGDTSQEGDKGAISDAFKRAAVKWSVGRYLYSIKAEWVSIEPYGKSYKLVKEELPKLIALLPAPIDSDLLAKIVSTAKLVYPEDDKMFDLCQWKSGKRARTYEELYQSEGVSLLKSLEGKLKE